MRVSGFAVGIMVALSYATGAGTANASDPKALACTFASGRAHTFEKGRFKPVKASAVKIAIGDIDADKQTAKLLGGGGATALRVVRAVNALHFIEIVGEGPHNVAFKQECQADARHDDRGDDRGSTACNKPEPQRPRSHGVSSSTR